MAAAHRIQRSPKDRHFYTWVAVLTGIIVFAGFAQSYYLKNLFDAPALSRLVHIHGIVMTVWFSLFVVQSRLVATHRVIWHRRLGVFGAVWAVIVLVMGVATAIVATKRDAASNPEALPFMVVPLGDMLVFAILTAAALIYRRRIDIHKRLMLLSFVGLLAAAISRIPLNFIATGGALVFFGLTDLCVLACVAYDTIKNRRLHPAFIWGTLLIIASQPLRMMLSETQIWMEFARWLTG
jgi:hypothetical protein